MREWRACKAPDEFNFEDAANDMDSEVEDGVVLFRDVRGSGASNSTLGPVLVLLRHVAEMAIRIAPILDAIGDESAARIASRSLVSERFLDLLTTSGDARDRVVAEVSHSYTFPELFVPADKSDDPASLPALVPAWGLTPRKPLAVLAKAAGGTRARVPACAMMAKPNSRTLTRASKLSPPEGCLQLIYPNGGLRVVRTPASAGDGVVFEPVYTQQEGQFLGFEHVAIPLTLSHSSQELGAGGKRTVFSVAQAVKDTIVKKSREVLRMDTKSQLLVRGSGHPASFSTAVACKAFRSVLADARQIIAMRAQSMATRKDGGNVISKWLDPLRVNMVPTLEDVLLAITTFVEEAPRNTTALALVFESGRHSALPRVAQIAWIDDTSRRRANKAFETLSFHPSPGEEFRDTMPLSAGDSQAAANAVTPPPPSDFFAAAFGEDLSKLTEGDGKPPPPPAPNALFNADTQPEDEDTALMAPEKVGNAFQFQGNTSESASAVYARVCEASAVVSPPWFAACCGSEMISLSKQHSLVDAADFPTFECRRKHGPAVFLPCTVIHDGFCDCDADGIDEVASGGCPFTWFFCESGANVVKSGNLVAHGQARTLPYEELLQLSDEKRAESGYISASKVKDGVADCVSGEDER
jgi:hypothetical protein